MTGVEGGMSLAKMPGVPLTWGLNFYLLEPNIQSDDLALESKDDLQKRTIKAGMGFTGCLYYKFGEQHPPEWTRLVGPNLKTKVDFPDGQSVSAVLFIRTKNGSYAYTFGVGGRSLLKRDAFVPEFGKKTVLSIADPSRLRSIDLRAMRDQPFLTRLQPSRGTRLRAFGIDTLQDHLRAVTGIPHGQHATLAKQVVGADSLSYRAPLQFSELGTKSDAFLDAFNTNAYRQINDFKWIDQINLVRSQAKVDVLDGLMLNRVKQNEFEFAQPDLTHWSRGPAFAFDPDTPPEERFEFLSREAFLDVVGPANLNKLTIAQLKDLTVYCFYDNEAESEAKWRAYDCIEVDLDVQGEHFVFAGGRWSAVAADFLEVVDNYMEGLKQNGPALPPASIQQDGNAKGDHVEEGKYIARLTGANANTMAKVHECGQEIRVDGDEVELCDIFDVAKDFLHLKIWRGSQGFSALAMQASNAAELLMGNKQFLVDSRTLLRGLGNHCAGVLPDGFNPRDYRIVLVLIRKEAGDIPFFSRLTLMRAAERIEGKALRAAYVVIPVQ